jgi:hypothetical protein
VSSRDRLGTLLSPDLLDALDAYINERIALTLAALPSATNDPEWLTLEQAASRLGCTTDAVRMRAKRGRLSKRNQGRRVYVSRASADELR